MRITNLGTSHGDPTPEHFCSSTLLETGGRLYLVDCGEPANALLVRRGLCASQLSGIFVTHMHIDHTGSLPVLCEQAAKYRRRFPDIRLSILLPEAAAFDKLAAWRDANHYGRFDHRAEHDGGAPVFGELRAYDETHGYDDGTLAMTAVRTDHLAHLHNPDVSAFSLQFACEGKRVLFTGDLAADFHDFPLDAAQDCDLVFCEVTHYPLEKALPTLARLRAGRLIFYHIGDPWQPADRQRLALDLCRQLPFPVSFAHDGCVTTL